MKPVYVIRDLELIRQVSIKDFDSFVNHKGVFSEEGDTLFAKNLFVLRDQKWRDMRSTLSPAFTGSKMRHMFALIASISNDYMAETSKTIKTESQIDFKDFSNKYCNDVIFKCAFGVSINSLSDPNNEFYTSGKRITNFPLSLQLKFMGFAIAPKLMSVRK